MERNVIEQQFKAAQQLRQNVENVINSYDSLLKKSRENPNEVKIIHHENITALVQNVDKLYKCMSELTSELKKHLQVWLRNLQLKYAELAIPSDFESTIELLSQRCANVGKELFYTEAMLKQHHCIIGNDIVLKFTELLREFMNSTMVVTQQDFFCVNVTKTKPFPKFELRMLAADFIPREEKMTVNAIFVAEDDIKSDTASDLEIVKTKGRQLLPSTRTIDATAPRVGFTFDSIKLKEPFKRKQSGQKKMVHEEKYRILFYMEWKQTTFWTYSLPLVVITASNQKDNALASIMWQCVFTDVFSFPTSIPDLSMAEMAEMLQLKVKRLSPNCPLTDSNISYFHKLLFGKLNKSSEERIPLNRFCQDPMKHRSGFSFWKWFLGACNLIEKYLLPYWEHGLIIGFMSKKDAMLELTSDTYQPGTFILRFSETELENRDSINEVYGKLCSVVKLGKTKCPVSEPADKIGVKRKLTTDYEKMFEHTTVADSQELSKRTLARILLDGVTEESPPRHVYRYVYPSGDTTKKLFNLDRKVNPGRSSGYAKTKKIDVINTTFENLNIEDQPDDKRLRKSPDDFCIDVGVQASVCCTYDMGTQTEQCRASSPPMDITASSFNSSVVMSPVPGDYHVPDMDFPDEHSTLYETTQSLTDEVQHHIRGLEKHLTPEQLHTLSGWLTIPTDDVVRSNTDSWMSERRLSDEEFNDALQTTDSERFNADDLFSFNDHL